MLPCPMLALSKSEGFSLLALRNDGSLEGLRLYPQQCRRARSSESPSPSPGLSLFCNPSLCLRSAAASAPQLFPLLCSGGSSDPCPSRTVRATHAMPHLSRAPIPFGITSFAHPHPLTPIESHLCKNRGGGGVVYPLHIRPIQCTATPATPFRSMAYVTILWTARGGHMTLLRDVIPSSLRLLSALCASALSFSFTGQQTLVSRRHGTIPSLPRLHRCRGELHA
jgi:hypothetical protein